MNQGSYPLITYCRLSKEPRPPLSYTNNKDWYEESANAPTAGSSHLSRTNKDMGMQEIGDYRVGYEDWLMSYRILNPST